VGRVGGLGGILRIIGICNFLGGMYLAAAAAFIFSSIRFTVSRSAVLEDLYP
jgi:hypothetical protein